VVRDGGRGNPGVSGAGSPPGARPSPTCDFELDACCVVCPSPRVAPTFVVAATSRAGELVGAPTFV